MTVFLRCAGTGLLADGARLTWSMADGSRGRRWRAVAAKDGSITHSLLLEVDLDGRAARLELTTPAGLLTLHPDADAATLHGNVVALDGVRHIALPWGAEHGLSVDGRPIADAVTAHRLAGSLGVGERRSVEVVAIGPDLAPRQKTVEFERENHDRWRLTGPTDARTLVIDPRGVPVGLAEASEWPLELD